MRRKAAKEGKTGPPPAALTVMRLYISDNAPNSVQAVANLAAICKEYLAESFTLEIIDVLKDPLRALADGIVVTPSLTKTSPSPVAKIVGNLGERGDVLAALGIKA
jgi:circadian clock protein KaiB